MSVCGSAGGWLRRPAPGAYNEAGELMPIYEYICEKCGSVFEELESVTNRDKPHECPGCGEKKGRRIVSTFSAKSGGPTFTGGSCGRRGFS